VVDAALDGVAAEEDQWEDGALLVAIAALFCDGSFDNVVGSASRSDGEDTEEPREDQEERGEELHGGLEVSRNGESNRENGITELGRWF
jgi:hypothetical protein